MDPKPYIDKRSGLPVCCPLCEEPTIQWTGQDWFCPNCAYVGEEALFPPVPKKDESIYRHPQPPEQEINLDLDPLSAAFLQRLSRKWEMSPADAVVTLIKRAAQAEFSAQGESNGTNEVRYSREWKRRQSTINDKSTPPDEHSESSR